MESKITSKTSCLKALLSKAWRERWSDLQWAINIKSVLPRGVSGDVYNLADCILQQALVGSGANPLVLSYLKHSLSAQLVSHAAVLQRLSKYNQFHKVHCVFSLLEFLEGMLAGITCSGKPEETVLACTLLSTVGWLLQILQQCMSKVPIVEKAGYLLQMLLKDDFYVTMICLARYIDQELFMETTSRCMDLQGTLSETDPLFQSILLLKKLDINALSLPITADTWPGSLIQYWVTVTLLENPGCPTNILVNQLQLFQRLKGYNSSRLYAELIRSSLLALHDGSQTTDQSHCGAFAFLKVPNLLTELTNGSENKTTSEAIDLLLQHTPLLDALDTNSPCSSLECLLMELAKARLLTEDQVQELLKKRESPAGLKLETTPPPNAGIPKVIICTLPTLAGILKTLSNDHNIQDALISMLHRVLTGTTFELILAVATVQGQLRTLVTRLIRLNECSKIGGDKARVELFDISFLILVAIVQTYGADEVLDEDGTSFFEQWVHVCMVEAKKPKAPEQILNLCDPNIVDSLLQQFNSGEADFKSHVKWQDIVFNIPGVMKEVLVAWEQGALLAADVKRILDAIKGRMCSLTLAAASWLCGYMRTAPQDTLLKPVNMVQQLLAAPGAEEEDSWQLTREIIRRMQRDVQLPMHSKSFRHLVSRQPAAEQLRTVWTQAIGKGRLDYHSATTIHGLLDTAGSRWLVSAVVQELIHLRYRDQLKRGVDLALALFHVDIQACSLELMAHTLPQLLYNIVQDDSITEPQLSAVALLSAFCVYTAVESTTNDDYAEPTPKKYKSSENSEEKLIAALRQLLLMLESGVLEGHVTQQTYFTFHFLKFLVEVRTSKARLVLSAVPPPLVSELLRTLPELFSPSLLLHLNDIHTTSGRSNIARDLCVLRNHHLRNVTLIG